MGNLLFVRVVVEASELKSVIDRCYPLDETVAAHRYVDTGRKKATSSSWSGRANHHN
ncbi:MAG: hypothetical protein ACK4SA_12700 [Caldilinea sp.]